MADLKPITDQMTRAATLMDAATLYIEKVPQLIADAVAAALAADPGATGTEIQAIVNTEVAAIQTAGDRLTTALFAGTPPGTGNL